MEKIILVCCICLFVFSLSYAQTSKEETQKFLDDIEELQKEGIITEEMKKEMIKLEEEPPKEVQLIVNEDSAAADIVIIASWVETYRAINNSYPDNLKILSEGEIPYFNPKSGFIIVSDNTISKHGYNFIYAYTSEGYIIIADPTTPGVTGNKRYFLDESGIVRFTSDGSKPSINSSPLKEK